MRVDGSPLLLQLDAWLANTTLSLGGLTSSPGGLTSPLVRFLLYNSAPSAAAPHGLHPRYTPLPVNLPLMCAPLLLALALAAGWLRAGLNHPSNSNSNNNNYDSSCSQAEGALGAAQRHVRARLPLLVCVAAAFLVPPLLLLSLAPHQEPRFLLPLVAVVAVAAAAVAAAAVAVAAAAAAVAEAQAKAEAEAEASNAQAEARKVEAEATAEGAAEAGAEEEEEEEAEEAAAGDSSTTLRKRGTASSSNIDSSGGNITAKAGTATNTKHSESAQQLESKSMAKSDRGLERRRQKQLRQLWLVRFVQFFLLFNGVLTVVFHALHQGGLTSITTKLPTVIFNGRASHTGGRHRAAAAGQSVLVSHVLFVDTYPPPLSLLGLEQLTQHGDQHQQQQEQQQPQQATRVAAAVRAVAHSTSGVSATHCGRRNIGGHPRSQLWPKTDAADVVCSHEVRSTAAATELLSALAALSAVDSQSAKHDAAYFIVSPVSLAVQSGLLPLSALPLTVGAAVTVSGDSSKSSIDKDQSGSSRWDRVWQRLASLSTVSDNNMNDAVGDKSGSVKSALKGSVALTVSALSPLHVSFESFPQSFDQLGLVLLTVAVPPTPQQH